MNKLHRLTGLALMLGVLLLMAPAARAGLEAAEGLMKQMPGDLPVAVVMADFDKLDKTIKQWGKRIVPDQPESSPLDDMRREISVADWVDFTKPLALALVQAGGEEKTAFWVNVPGFAEKIAKHEGAKKVEDLWEFPLKEQPDKTLVVKELEGGYVVVAASKDDLAKATAKGPSLADALRPRADMLKDRDFVMHLEMKHFRDQALAGLAQASMMLPMIGAMAAGQAGDPAAAVNLQAMLSAVLDSSKKFVEQLAYLDIVAGMDAQEANVTLATGYTDGPIKSYLASVAPASAPLLTTIEDQPYCIAFGAHVPGGMGPVTEYFTKRMDESLKALPPPAAPASAPGDKPAGETPPEPAKSAMAEALKLSMDMSAMTEAVSMIMAVEKDGMKMVGDAQVKDPARYMELLKTSMAASNEMMKSFGGGGMTYELLGPTKINDVSVEQFSLKIDEKAAAAGGMGMGMPDISKLYGANTRYGAGIAKGRVRFCMGAEADMQKAFGKPVEKPFASGRHVEAALKKLPAKRSGVMLLDLAGIVPIMELFGQPMSGPMPAGTPFAISFSIAGEPARMDINIPLKAIERVVQAFSPQQPM